MEKIVTLKHARIVISQRFYNPDDPEEEGRLEETDLTPMQPDLPVLRPEDLEGALEDDYDDEGTLEPEEEYEEPELVYPPEDAYPEFATTGDALNYAERNNEIMRIHYTTKRGRDISREVEPHGQFYARTTGNRILVTFDRTVEDIRAFIIDNIRYHVFLGEDFEHKFIVSSGERIINHE